MHCKLVIHLVNARGVLPPAIDAWASRRWLDHHVRECDRCRTHQARLQRLDECFRLLPASEALSAGS
jgi:hypothetical protein